MTTIRNRVFQSYAKAELAHTSGREGSARRDWPIIIGGCHRSGTTLVHRLLDAHPRIHCGPEVTFFRDFYADYSDDPLRHLRFAQTARSLVSEEELLELMGMSFVALHERAAAHADKPRWADKVPDNVLHLKSWERLLDGRFLVIHMVRNPLDTLASMMEARFNLTVPPDLDGRIAHYGRYTEAGLVFAERNPARCYQVVYDELCEQPRATLERLMAWLGEAFDTRQLAFHEKPLKGLEDPKIAGTTGVHSLSVGRWPSSLSAADAGIVWERTKGIWMRVDREMRWVAPPGR